MLLPLGCREKPETQKPPLPQAGRESHLELQYASGFTARTDSSGITYLTISDPWPGASRKFEYALVPREQLASVTLPADAFDAIIPVPVSKLVLTSTTHIPSLEALGALETLVGFPGLDYISSPGVRQRIARGEIAELGANEQLNIEMVMETAPELVVGFGVSDAPGSYRKIADAGIPVVYNGDWMEQNPLGKAEWVKFFGLLLNDLPRAEAYFAEVEAAYLEAREVARSATSQPSVLSGALYRDIWYLPGGDSWAAAFLEDANARYLWADTPGGGSLSLSLEAVLDKGVQADFWVSPSQYTSYSEMAAANPHYEQFRAFRERRIFGYAGTRGPARGLLYYELGPSRPDLILKDLVHYLHPGLLQDYEPVFFKPLKP
ncbi:ABC transporter substrate-binding protein [Robiginitalea sp. SC105]|nr:ABC transporter substrate-binding protein [Robiginitalea sp. SC105]MBC2839457.1 ABC transporter substrate-binding protein [Robiginitalea sp. SC105]